MSSSTSPNNGFCIATLSSSSSSPSSSSLSLSAVGLDDEGLRPPFRRSTTATLLQILWNGRICCRCLPMANVAGRRSVGGQSSSTSLLTVLFFVLISLIFIPNRTTGKKIWTIEELQTYQFPYLTTNDLYVDVCKAGGFLVDIALTRDEIDELEKFNSTIKQLTKKIENLNHTKENEIETKNISSINENTDTKKRFTKKTKHSLKWKSAQKKLKMVTRRGHSRQKRAATGRPERIWEYAVIPYEIQANFSGEHQALFRRAMNHWENYTCLSFVPRTADDESYIVFTVAECGCCSFVGKRGDGPQAISIGKNCDKFGIVVHELGHVVGFWHEHTRPDREEFVDIFYKNIQQGQDYNFEKLKGTEVNSLGQPYDYASIMHYARDTFARAMYLDTILPKPDSITHERPEIGQRVRLSPGDIDQTNLLYGCPKCSQSFLEPKGTFYSPVSDNTLENIGVPQTPIHCQWRISGPHGSRVLLNITSLGIADSPDCSGNHYLEIRDGYFVKSRLIGRYCGNMGPLTIISATNRLWLEYKSPPESSLSSKSEEIGSETNSVHFDHPNNKGFYASYESLCGGEIISDTGVIESTNYPYDYSPNSDCAWLITVPDDYQVAIIFTLFQLEQHDDCIYDFIQFQDGHDENSPVIGRFCGYVTPTNVKSSTNKMRVKFASDASVEKAGFSLKFIKEFDECKTTNHGCQHKCINTLGGYRCECDIGFELHTDGKSCEDACGGYLKGENGTVTSPNFPNAYPHKKRCIWEIEANAQYRITLNFTHFDLEGVHTSCEYDYVKVSSIDDDGNLAKVHGTYCGKVGPLFLVTSETNHLRIEFASDSSVAKSGFAAVYFTDKDECDIDNGGCEQICKNVIGSYKCDCESGYILSQDGHHCKEGGCKFELMAPSGHINSPNYPEEYPNKKECVWHFVTTPGHRLQIDFVEFEIEPHQDCAYDRIELYDGSSATATSLGRYCGPKAPEKLLTSKNEMFMVFKSDSSVQRKGFKALYTTVCGGTLLADRSMGFIYSHAAYGGFSYDNKMYCDWTILARDNLGVGLKFTNFELEDEYNCEYDYVELYDGEDDEAIKIGRFCGNKIPSTFISSGSALRLHFRSDDTVGVKGFLAEYFLTEPSEQVITTETPGLSTRPPFEPIINERIKNHY